MSFISDEILILLLHVSVKLLNKENLQLVVCSNLFTVQIHIMLFLYFFFLNDSRKVHKHQNTKVEYDENSKQT